MRRCIHGILLLALVLLITPTAGAQCRAASGTSFDFVETPSLPEYVLLDSKYGRFLARWRQAIFLALERKRFLAAL